MNAEEKSLFIKGKLKKAAALLTEIKVLTDLGYLETATNRCYYSCFYCVQALLAAIDVYPKSHRGTLSMFSLHYAKSAKFPLALARFFQEIFTQRQLSDYSDGHEISAEMAALFLSNARQFIETTKDLLDQQK